MSASHKAVIGSSVSVRTVSRALLSVSDKTGLVPFAKYLVSKNVELVSTGGTAKVIRDAGLAVIDAGEVTGFPEILNGRVKTLHPKIHGGILAVRGNELHEKEVADHGIDYIDMVVLNLYPFKETVSSGKDFNTCVENIDIGGPAMLRAAAKNFPSVAVLTSPTQYEAIMEKSEDVLSTTIEERKHFACCAFQLSATYDASISNYLTSQTLSAPQIHTKQYDQVQLLKYGCNPNQKPAFLHALAENQLSLPFSVLNGTPGYINYLDALNSWQLVRELGLALDLPAAASFKHVSPAGCGVYVPLTKEETLAFDLGDKFVPESCSQLEIAYIRARQADPMSSFGDFIALSQTVDVKTAKRIKSDISDGIIAPDFEPEALEILSAKKGGKFIVIRMNPAFEPAGAEFREVFGVGLSQTRNKNNVREGIEKGEIITKKNGLSEAAKRDMVVGNITIKYTQSNSVAFAKNGQVVGVGAGQQSRVDCVKLAGKKAMIFFLRQHPDIAGIKFRPGIKRQDRINARVAFIECVLSKELDELTHRQLMQVMDVDVKSVYETVTKLWLGKVDGVTLVSDAFFPFRDNIDVCSNLGFKVDFVAQTGGSVKDADVAEACDEHGILMVLTGQRLFHH